MCGYILSCVVELKVGKFKPEYAGKLNFYLFRGRRRDAHEIELYLKLGSLPTHKDKSGTLARSHNMALLSEVTVSDEDLARSVKVYQKGLLKQATPFGQVADITEDVGTRHTKP